MSRAAQGIARFHSTGDTAAAAAAIAADRGDAALTMVFASAAHDLKQLGSELAARGVRRVIGASTGRIISAQGFEP